MKKPAGIDKETWAKVRASFDKIYDSYRDNYRGFWEIKGSYCGDMRCMRFYDSGLVTER